MNPQMKRGFVEACVLASVSARESYGYQIIRDVPEALGLTESTLYPVLKRLEGAGHVSVRSAEHNGRLRKYYRITDEGRAQLATFVTERAEVRAIYDYIEGATVADPATTVATADVTAEIAGDKADTATPAAPSATNPLPAKGANHD